MTTTYTETERPVVEIERPVRFDFLPRQLEAIAALRDPAIHEVLYGGAKGGGKSVLLVRWAFLHAMEIVAEYSLQPRKHPPVLGWIGRKQAVDFDKTTRRAWERFVPPDVYTIREQAHQIVLLGGVCGIDYGGLDRTEDIQKFNSAEYGFFALDQAEEVTQDEVAALRGSLRLVLDSAKGIIPRKALFTANPAQCWLKDEFVTRPAADRRFVPALPKDNAFLGHEYTETLQAAFKHRPELLAAYLEGDWNAFEGEAQLIKIAWLMHARGLTLYPVPIVRCIACDPARFGDDETVIYGYENTDIKWAEVYGQKDTMYTANRLAVRSRQNGDCPVIVDEIGIGSGIVDRLMELGIDVVGVNAASASSDPAKWVNLRAEMWDYVASMLAQGDVGLSWKDDVLDNQLCAPTYSFRRGAMLLEPKDDIKERLGRSPDRADAAILGWCGVEYKRKRGPLAKPQEGLRAKTPDKKDPVVTSRSFAARRMDYDAAKKARETW